MFSTKIIDTLAQVESVDRGRMKLLRGDDDVSEYDTPKSLKLRISDILECVIIDPTSVPTEPDNTDLDMTGDAEDDSVQIKVQGQDRTSKMMCTLKKVCDIFRCGVGS